MFFLVIFRWREKSAGLELALAMFVGLAWAASIAYSINQELATGIIGVSLEIVRNLVWGYLLLKLIRLLSDVRSAWYRTLERLTYAIPIALLALLLFASGSESSLGIWLGYDVRIAGHLMMSLLGFILVEQIFRMSGEQRWAFKFVCLGFGGLYLFDFYIYAEALLFQSLNIEAWVSRGFVVSIAFVFVAVGISRFPVTSLRLTLSRPVVFYSTGLVFSGIYLLIVAAGGYYLKAFGGDWGAVARNAFLFAALLFLLALVSSGEMRGRLRVYIDKHFLNYKYDYREEWLGLIRQLSAEQNVDRLEERAVKAIADMMDSPGSALWLKNSKDTYYPAAHFSMGEFQGVSESRSGELVQFLEQWQWVINVEEYKTEPDLYQGLHLSNWITESENIWLIMPLMMQTRLFGFVVLAKPRANKEFNWEDIDLLKTVGRQVAIHLAQARSALDLVEARQFEAFNRLSAYVMHDLKNLMSQLGLVVKNAEKHKSNPAFVDDAINTVDNAVARMHRLLAQLKSETLSMEKSEVVDMAEILNRVVKDKAHQQPAPQLVESVSCFVTADKDRLVSVIGHIVQNAQDATPSGGYVRVSARLDNETVNIKISDNGSGMDEEFIKNRLFKAFDSTKGLTGMGIGAHEVRQFIEELGGIVEVDSRLGEGTTFWLKIPLVEKR